MSEQLHALSPIVALAALRSGTTSESLARALLDRIAATDANVQAWAYLETAADPGAARRSGGERAAGSATGLRSARLPPGGPP